MSKHDHTGKIGRIIAKAWADPAFMQRLLADATAVFKEEGLPVPEGVTVQAVADSPSVVNLLVPMPPAGRDLSDEELGAVAAGGNLEGKTCATWEWCTNPPGMFWAN